MNLSVVAPAPVEDNSANGETTAAYQQETLEVEEVNHVDATENVQEAGTEAAEVGIEEGEGAEALHVQHALASQELEFRAMLSTEERSNDAQHTELDQNIHSQSDTAMNIDDINWNDIHTTMQAKPTTSPQMPVESRKRPRLEDDVDDSNILGAAATATNQEACCSKSLFHAYSPSLSGKYLFI